MEPVVLKGTSRSIQWGRGNYSIVLTSGTTMPLSNTADIALTFPNNGSLLMGKRCEWSVLLAVEGLGTRTMPQRCNYKPMTLMIDNLCQCLLLFRKLRWP